jgi:hypothetical protein
MKETKPVLGDDVQDIFEWYCGRAVLLLCEKMPGEMGIDITDDAYKLHSENSYDSLNRKLTISFTVPRTFIDKNGAFLISLEDMVVTDHLKTASHVAVKTFRQHINLERTNKIWDKYWPDSDDIFIRLHFRKDVDIRAKELYHAIQAAKAKEESKGKS